MSLRMVTLLILDLMCNLWHGHPAREISFKTTIRKYEKQARPAKTIDEHLNGASAELKRVFNEVNEMIMEISSEIERYTTNTEIVYKTSINFADLPFIIKGYNTMSVKHGR